MARSTSSIRSRSARKGLTLMEMLLVMALMVIVASLAAPAFRRPMENFRLRKAGDAIRIAFTRARIRAMKSGQTHLFRYQVGGNGYTVELWRADDAYLEAGMEVDVNETAPLGNLSGAQGSQGDANVDLDVFMSGVQEELPEGVRFHGGLIEADMRAAMLDETSSNGAGPGLNANPGLAGGDGQSSWSQPILFYPDGTTSDAKVLLVNRNTVFVRIDLRGLTGVAKSSAVLDQNQLELPNADLPQ